MVETAWEQKTLVQKILERQKQGENVREPYDDRFADIVDYVQPGLTSWLDEDSEGTFRGEKIFEGTPPWALRTMTNGWLGNLVNEGLTWFKYKFSDPILKDDDAVNKHLQNREEHMVSVYQRSELYAALNPYTRAAFSVGSPVIIPFFSRKENRIKFEVPHPKENFHLAHQGYHRKFKKTALDAVLEFMDGKVPETEDDTKLPLSPALIQDFRTGNHNNKHEFIRAIYQKDDPILEGQPSKFKNKPWMEFYVEANSADDNREPVKVQGYFTKPHIRWDYEINTDELYARTPAWNCMMDIRSGQVLARQKMERGELELNPHMWVQRKYRPFHHRPGGRTYYDKAEDVENIPTPIHHQGSYAIAENETEIRKESIERWFAVPLFSQLSRMASGGKAGFPTATHVIHLNAEQAVLLSPAIGRFTNVIRQIDNRCQDIERRRGASPMRPEDMPDLLHEFMAFKKEQEGATSLPLDMDFLGELAQMQQRGITLGKTEAGLAIAKAYMEVDPLLIHKVRWSVSMESDLEQIGYNQDAIVPENEYQKTLEGIAEAEAEQRQLEAAGAQADMVPKLSGSVDPDSPMAAGLEQGAA